MTTINHGELVEPAKIWPSIGLFLAFTAVFSGLIDLVLIEFGLRRYYIAALMWSPGLSALLTLKIMRIPIDVIGWRWGKARFHWACYFLPLIYGFIAYGFIWSTGLGGFLSSDFIHEAQKFLGLSGFDRMGVVLVSVVIFSTVGLLWHFITSLGEEIGWRGFLTPFLLRKLTFFQASVITGLIWALWHLPLIYFTGYNAGPRYLDMQMLNFTVLAVGLSFPMTYYRVRSKSVWTSVMLHAAHNVFILSIFHPLTVKYDYTYFYAGEFGVVLPLVMVGVALFYWWMASRDGIKGRIGEEQSNGNI